jgi:hypothetical protein
MAKVVSAVHRTEEVAPCGFEAMARRTPSALLLG